MVCKFKFMSYGRREKDLALYRAEKSAEVFREQKFRQCTFLRCLIIYSPDFSNSEELFVILLELFKLSNKSVLTVLCYSWAQVTHTYNLADDKINKNTLFIQFNQI